MFYIIGADIAGLRFANHLSDLSLDTFVFDKKREIIPDNKDYVILNENHLAKLGLRKIANSALVNELRHVRFNSPYGKKAKIDTAGTFSVYDKSTIEYLLYKKLQKKNKEVILSARFFDYNKKNNNVFFEEKGKGTLRKADVIFGCDGLFSNVRDKLFNFPLGKKQIVTCELRGSFDKDIVDFFISSSSSGLYNMVCPISDTKAFFVGVESDKQVLDEFFRKNGWNVVGNITYKEVGYYTGKKPILADRSMLLGSAGGIFNNLSGENFFESIKSADIAFDILKTNLRKGKTSNRDKFNFSRQSFMFDSLYTDLDYKARIRNDLYNVSENKIDRLIQKMHNKRINYNLQYPFEIMENVLKKKFVFF